MADEVMAEVEQQTATRGPAPGGVAPWVEKYRPATIDELQQQDQVALPQPPPLCQLYIACYSLVSRGMRSKMRSKSRRTPRCLCSCLLVC